MKWINVKDQKPELNQFVLCLREDALYSVLQYIGDYTFVPEIPYDPHYLTYNPLPRIIYWMPLPEPPN